MQVVREWFRGGRNEMPLGNAVLNLFHTAADPKLRGNDLAIHRALVAGQPVATPRAVFRLDAATGTNGRGW